MQPRASRVDDMGVRDLGVLSAVEDDDDADGVGTAQAPGRGKGKPTADRQPRQRAGDADREHHA